MQSVSQGPRQSAARPQQRVLIIYNPRAGVIAVRRISGVLTHLSRFGATVTVRRTETRGDAERIAAEASPDSFDVVVAAGGDGTINEVANGLASSGLPLALIPAGTANVLAAEIGLSERSRDIARTIVSGPVRAIRLGSANGRHFVMMAGVGFDAHLVSHINTWLKRRLGRATYVAHALISVFGFPYRRYHVTVDGATYDAASAVIANGRRYGGPFSCAPNAHLEAPYLDVCLFLRSGPWNVVRYATALALGRLHRLDDVVVVRGSEITINGTDGEPVQCDGDITARLPLNARADTFVLPLIVPQSAS